MPRHQHRQGHRQDRDQEQNQQQHSQAGQNREKRGNGGRDDHQHRGYRGHQGNNRDRGDHHDRGGRQDRHGHKGPDHRGGGYHAEQDKAERSPRQDDGKSPQRRHDHGQQKPQNFPLNQSNQNNNQRRPKRPPRQRRDSGSHPIPQQQQQQQQEPEFWNHQIDYDEVEMTTEDDLLPPNMTNTVSNNFRSFVPEANTVPYPNTVSHPNAVPNTGQDCVCRLLGYIFDLGQHVFRRKFESVEEQVNYLKWSEGFHRLRGQFLHEWHCRIEHTLQQKQTALQNLQHEAEQARTVIQQAEQMQQGQFLQAQHQASPSQQPQFQQPPAQQPPTQQSQTQAPWTSHNHQPQPQSRPHQQQSQPTYPVPIATQPTAPQTWYARLLALESLSARLATSLSNSHAIVTAHDASLAGTTMSPHAPHAAEINSFFNALESVVDKAMGRVKKHLEDAWRIREVNGAFYIVGEQERAFLKEWEKVCKEGGNEWWYAGVRRFEREVVRGLEEMDRKGGKIGVEEGVWQGYLWELKVFGERLRGFEGKWLVEHQGPFRTYRG